MTELKIVGIVAVLLLLVGTVATVPLFLNVADGGIQVGSASPIPDYSDDPNDPYDLTKEVLWGDPLEGWEKTDFKIINQLNRKIRTPDEIVKEIIKKDSYIIEISPEEIAVLIGSTSEEDGPIEKELQYVEINGKIRVVSVYNFISANKVIINEFEHPLDDHFIDLGLGYYGVWPFDKPKNDDLTSIHNMIYVENPEKIKVLNKSMPWDDLIGKTPAEIFGEYGLAQSEQSENQVPEGEEKGIPGFKVIFAIAGLLAVAYFLKRKKWRKRKK